MAQAHAKKHVQLSPETEAALEAGGGVKKKTQQDRDRFAKHFKNFVDAETHKTVENLLDGENKSAEAHKEDLALLSLQFSRFFWTLRVDAWVK